MIITRAPMRISLGGGGTDLPSYYREFGGFLIAAAIDRHVYINIHRRFVDGFLLKYSQLEEARSVDEIRHPIIREALRMMELHDSNLEITSMADMPAGTGLGSSGTFSAALLRALHAYKRTPITPGELAEKACRIEIDILKEPVGKQDQFIAAYGGVMCFTFHHNGTVDAAPLDVSPETLYNLEDNLVLFFTGYSRNASSILKQQDDRSREKDNAMLDNLHFIKNLGYRSKSALESGNLAEFGRLMNVHWEHKKQRSPEMSNDRIDEWYRCAVENGALGES